MGEKNLDAWRKEKRSVILENGQWTMLKTYILLTTAYRKAELENWKKLASEYDVDPQDDPDEISDVTEMAEENAEFWKNMDELLDLIEREL